MRFLYLTFLGAFQLITYVIVVFLCLAVLYWLIALSVIVASGRSSCRGREYKFVRQSPSTALTKHHSL